MDIVAKQLAASLNQKGIRHFIKKEALKKFDGDFDILYDKVKSQVMEGKTFQNHLGTLNFSVSGTSKNTIKQLENITSSLPLLNISIPVNIEKWDTESFTPLVAIVPADYDEKTSSKIKAYDKYGKIHWLDAKKKPDFPVIAVGINERTKLSANGGITLKKECKPLFNPEVNIGTLKANKLLIAPIDEGGGGGGGSPSLCRIDGQREYIDGIIFPDNYLQTMYEDWILGAPELKLSIFKPINNFTELGEFYTTNYEPANRSDVNNKWQYFNGSWPLFNWYNADYGNIVIYKWIEEDSGSIITIDIKGTISGVELKGTLNIRNNDDEILTTPVDQRDCDAVKIYGPPSFKFQIKHQ